MDALCLYSYSGDHTIDAAALKHVQRMATSISESFWVIILKHSYMFFFFFSLSNPGFCLKGAQDMSFSFFKLFFTKALFALLC